MKKKLLLMMSLVALSGMTITGCSKENTEVVESTSVVEGTEVAGTEETGTAESEDTSKYALDTTGLNTDGSLSELDCTEYVTLGEYKGVEVKVAPIVVSDEDVESQLQQAAEYFLTETQLIEEGEIKEGDTARIDYVGKKDGVAFDGGSAEDYDLAIGSGSFIEGFEAGLVGAKVGDTVTLDLTFPADYGNEELAGQAVVFDVTVKGIVLNVVGELTDENASEVASQMGVEATDLASLKVAMKDAMVEQQQSSRDSDLQYKVTEVVYGNITVNKTPEFLKNRIAIRMDNNFTYQAMMYGMDAPSLFAAYYAIEAKDYASKIMEMAAEYANQYVAFQQIAALEGITITDEEAKAEIESMYSQYGYESADAFLAEYPLDTYKDDMMFQKVVSFLVENANVVEDASLATE